MRIILLILLLHTALVNAQLKYDVRIVNDTVYNNGQPQFLCRETAKGQSKAYSLRSLEGKPQALINFTEKDSHIVCAAHFPTYMMRYDILYPLIDISVLMESYLRNKVIVNGMIDTVGLKAYCSERNIVLRNIETRKLKRPAINDSVMAANAKADFESQIPFIVYNNSEKAVRISIGTPSNNRIIIIPPVASQQQRARLDDKVCIVESNKTLGECIVVSKKSKEFYINADGKTFEKSQTD